ncbi:MAG: hypothetical protein IJX03_03745 [Clostridia bacterium]|nr:hypothetical protein [Clostridia bacterium]
MQFQSKRKARFLPCFFCYGCVRDEPNKHQTKDFAGQKILWEEEGQWQNQALL